LTSISVLVGESELAGKLVRHDPPYKLSW